MALKKLVLLSALASVSAFAQTSPGTALGTVVRVEGVVTATQGATGTTVTVGAPVLNGTRYVTTTTGRTTLRMNNGCEVNLNPSQALTVLQTMNCDQLLAARQNIVPVAPGPAFGPNPAFVNGVILLGAAGLVWQTYSDLRKSDPSVSPN